MKLEMRKFHIKSYIRAGCIANVIILALICMISFNSEIKEEIAFTSYSVAFSTIDTLIRATYIVFAAVLIARLVIDEFRNRSITVLFMYPINRKVLMAAKLLVVVLFTLIGHLIASIFVGIGFYILNIWVPIIDDSITWSIVSRSMLMSMMSAVATSFLALIPLYFGMRKHSIAATIVSSLIVVAVVCQSVDGFSLYSIIAIPIGLALSGAAIAYLSIRNIERTDVL